MFQDIDYECMNLNAEEDERKRWKATISQLSKKADGFEGTISGRGSSMYFIIGKSNRGNYICLPDWGIGSELADLNDIFWNRERLQSKELSVVDSITLSKGLSIIAKFQ